MIASIDGIVKLVAKDGIILQTKSGLGYFINLTSSATHSAKISDEIFLFTEQVIKEDSHLLYGFTEYEELLWFRALLKVSGVGSKTALNIISNIGIGEIANAIQDSNEALFASVSGLGKKTANRIVTDMQKEPHKIHILLASTDCALATKPQTSITANKQEILKEEPVKQTTKSTKANQDAKTATKEDLKIQRERINDVSLALEALGYDKLNAFTMASLACKNNKNASVNELVKQVLQGFDKN
jgi:holliday junction DNA helicase RuvA